MKNKNQIKKSKKKIIPTNHKKAKELFIEESNVQSIDASITIYSDIHGQFDDLTE